MGWNAEREKGEDGEEEDGLKDNGISSRRAMMLERRAESGSECQGPSRRGGREKELCCAAQRRCRCRSEE